jgi:hypothetical protein
MPVMLGFSRGAVDRAVRVFGRGVNRVELEHFGT